MEDKEDIKLIFFLNLSFILFELIGGFLTNSVAIIAYAISNLSNCLIIGINYLIFKLTNNKQIKKYSFGYKRFSLLGTFLTSIILFVLSILTIFYTFFRFLVPVKLNIIGIIIFAILGIVINSYAMFKTSKEINNNQNVININIFSGIIGWVVILIISLIIKITDYPYFDLILALIISLYIVYKAIKNIRKIFNIITDATPKNIDLEKLESEIKENSLIKEINNLHVWSIDEEEICLIMQVVILKNKKNYNNLLEDIKNKLKEKGINNSNIEIIYSNE